MDKNTILELEKQVLLGDASAMVKMSKYLLSGGQHPFLDARLLLESAKEAGNNEAAILLKLIDWEKQTPSSKGTGISIQKEDSMISETEYSDDELPETAGSNEEIPEYDINEEEDHELDSLLRARAIYRSWRDCKMSEQDSNEREEAMQLFEKSVTEYKKGERQMDEDLLEGLVLLAQFYNESDNDEKYLKYIKIGAENGQATLAYMYGQHLFRNNEINGAVECYKKALDGQFTKVCARQALAMIYLQTPGFFNKHKEESKKYIDEGIELLEKQETISSEYYVLYLLKGDYYRLSRKYKEACNQYESALDKLLTSDNAPKELAVIAAGNLAELYTIIGKSKIAKKYSLKKKELLQQL